MILRAFFLRFVTKHPIRFLATIFGVAIGVGSVIAIVLSCQAAIRAMVEDVEVIAGRAQFEITSPGSIPQTLLGDLRYLAKDAHIAPVVDGLVFVPKLNDMIRVLGLDMLTDASFRELEWEGNEGIQQEQMIEILRAEGVLVPHALAQQLDIQSGSSFEIVSQAQTHSLDVITTFEPQNFSSSWDRILIMDIAKAQTLLGKGGYIDRIEIIPRVGVKEQELKSQIVSALPPQYNLGTPSDRSDQTARMIRALRFNLTALSGISLLVGAVLVAITLYTSVIQRKYIIALLQSLGASRKQIAYGVLIEAGSIGILGGITGVVFGIVGSWMALSSVRATVAAVVQGVPASSIQIEPMLVVVGIALGLMVSLLSSYWAVREALKTPPLQGLKADNPERKTVTSYFVNVGLALLFVIIAIGSIYLPPYKGLPVPALFSALFVLLTFVTLSPLAVDMTTWLVHKTVRSVKAVVIPLAASSLAAARERTALAASAICLSTALAISMTIMISSFRQTIVDWTSQATLSDLWIRPLKTSSGVPAGNLSPSLIDLAVKEFGVERVDPFYRSETIIDGEKVTLGAGAFHPVRTRTGGVPFMDERPSREVFQEAHKNNAVLVNESFMRRFGYGKGDVITMQVQDQTIQRKIEGVFYDYSSHQGNVIMDKDDFLQYYTTEGPEGIGVFLPDGISAQEGRETLREKIPPNYAVDIMLNQELRQEIMRVFERTFSITYALQIISSVVAGIAVLSVLFALVGERKQDLALLQSIGATGVQVIQMVIGKALIMGVIGLIGGIAAGYFVGVILVEVVNLQSFNWTLRFAMPWMEISFMAVLVLIACSLAAIAPALTVANQSLQEVLRADE